MKFNYTIENLKINCHFNKVLPTLQTKKYILF